MNNQEAYITGSCIIRDHRIYRNGNVVWEQEPHTTPADFLRAGYDHFSGQYPKFHKMDPLSRLGWLAAEVLLQDAPLAGYDPSTAGLVLSNRSASLDTDLRYYATVSDIPSPALFVYTLANIVMGEICIRHGFKGEQNFFITEDFDASLITAYTQQLLAATPLRACLCGWVEVMGDQYEAALFLTTTDVAENALPLSAATLSELYHQNKINK